MTTKQPINYLEFNNPIHIVWRKGTASDPFVDRLDISLVVNQRVALLEIPDETHRVRIANMQEVNYEKFIKSRLEVNEFYCDYTNGFVYFNKAKEAETLSIVYKGRGVILYPTERIIHYDGTTSTESLYKIIEDSKDVIRDMIGKTDAFEEALNEMIIATNVAKDATDIVLQTNDKALQHIELIKDAYATTVLIYKPFVQTYNDILTTYPLPQVGWTVQVYDTGIRYRWDGMNWTPIDLFGGNIPNATTNNDGLMSKESFTKLDAISEKTNYRTIVFICTQDIMQGVQDPHVVFPHDGEIVEIKAFVSTTGLNKTEIDVEVSNDFQQWISIIDNPIVIESQEFKDNGQHNIITNRVNENDVFRLNVSTPDADALNLTVNIKIKID